jgi:hypothetical protein
VIALFQAALAAYLLYFVTIALLNPPDNLGFLRSAVRLLIGRTDRLSYVGSPHEVIAIDLFFLVGAALISSIQRRRRLGPLADRPDAGCAAPR